MPNVSLLTARPGHLRAPQISSRLPRRWLPVCPRVQAHRRMPCLPSLWGAPEQCGWRKEESEQGACGSVPSAGKGKQRLSAASRGWSTAQDRVDGKALTQLRVGLPARPLTPRPRPASERQEKILLLARKDSALGKTKVETLFNRSKHLLGSEGAELAAGGWGGGSFQSA